MVIITGILQRVMPIMWWIVTMWTQEICLAKWCGHHILGKIVRLVSNPLIFVPIILVPLAIILIANLVKTVSYARKIAKDEEEAAVKEAIQYIREKNLRETGDTTESNENSERKSE